MTNCYLGYCTGGQSSQGSLSSDLGREGTNTKVYKFPVKPYPILGYCGCTVKLEWYHIQTTISFIKAKAHALTFSSSKSSGIQEHMSKHFSRMTRHSKVFQNHFHQVFPSKVDPVLCLALASTCGGKY